MTLYYFPIITIWLPRNSYGNLHSAQNFTEQIKFPVTILLAHTSYNDIILRGYFAIITPGYRAIATDICTEQC